MRLLNSAQALILIAIDNAHSFVRDRTVVAPGDSYGKVGTAVAQSHSPLMPLSTHQFLLYSIQRERDFVLQPRRPQGLAAESNAFGIENW